MDPKTKKILLITIPIAVVVIAALLVVFLVVIPKLNVNRSTPIRTRGGKPSTKVVGGWTDQDISNPQILADAKELAIIATKNILDEKNFDFDFDEPVIEITNLQSQVVNGTNYRLEYSVEDTKGGHVLYVTALMYRGLQQPVSRSEVVKKDYAYENINRPADGQTPQTISLNDKNATKATSTADIQRRSTMKPRPGRGV